MGNNMQHKLLDQVKDRTSLEGLHPQAQPTPLHPRPEPPSSSTTPLSLPSQPLPLQYHSRNRVQDKDVAPHAAIKQASPRASPRAKGRAPPSSPRNLAVALRPPRLPTQLKLLQQLPLQSQLPVPAASCKQQGGLHLVPQGHPRGAEGGRPREVKGGAGDGRLQEPLLSLFPMRTLTLRK